MTFFLKFLEKLFYFPNPIKFLFHLNTHTYRMGQAPNFKGGLGDTWDHAPNFFLFVTPIFSQFWVPFWGALGPPRGNFPPSSIDFRNQRGILSNIEAGLHMLTR